MVQSSKILTIRNVRMIPPLALAPMVGISHSGLRSLICELGGCGLFFTEMLSAKRLPQENEAISPLLIKSFEEHPLFYQVFLSDTACIEPAIEKLHELKADGIDINFGCPAPKVKKQGAGVSLASDISLVEKIIRTFRKNTSTPVSAKIRIGESLDKEKFLALCKCLENEGVDLLTIHARLNKEKFCRKPRWEWISYAKNVLSIPILANGGIFCVEDAKKCLEMSGADGLMIGRAAAINPLIFSQIKNLLFREDIKNTQVNEHSALDIYMRFSDLLIDRFPEERRLGRLKQFTHYFALSYQFGHKFAYQVQNSNSMNQALDYAEDFLTKY